jgi:hypothetical protein
MDEPKPLYGAAQVNVDGVTADADIHHLTTDVLGGLPGRAFDIVNRAGLFKRPEPRFYLP